MTQEPQEHNDAPVDADFESTGSDELDERLAEPVFKGLAGLDTAMVWASAFLIVITGVIAYASVFGVPFHAGGRALVVDNEALHSVARFPEAAAPDAPGPLTLFTLALNWQLAPGSASVFHGFSLVLHLANGVLIYLLGRRLLGKRVPEAVAMLAGMLFVLHPVNVEAVASMVGRAELLGTFFALVSLLLFVHTTAASDRRWLSSLALGLLVYACAFGAHTGAWCAILIAVVVDAVANGPGWRWKRLAALASYGAVLAALLVVAVFSRDEPVSAVRAAIRAFDAGAVADAAVRAVWPFGLSVAPVAWESTGLAVTVLGVLFIVAVAGGAGAWLWRSAGGAGAAWFAIALASAVLAANEHGMADRALYLPLAGLVLVVPWGFSKLPEHPGIRTGAGLACAALLMTLGIAAHARTMVWQSEVALWRDAARKAPNLIAPQERLGNAYIESAASKLMEEAALRDGGYTTAAGTVRNEALEHFALGRDVLTTLPEDVLSAETLFHLGLAHKYLDDHAAALEAFLLSLEKDVSDQACALESAQLLHAQAAEEDDRAALLQALDFYAYAQTLGELPPHAAVEYGDVLARTGRLEEALQTLTAAIRQMEDGPAQFANRLQSMQTALQQTAAIETQARELEAQDPDSQEARLLGAQSLLMRNRPLQASYRLERILSADDAVSDAWVLLGYARAQMGQSESFLSEWPAPPGPAAQHAQLWTRLATMCAGRGDWDAAESYLLSTQAGMAGVRTPLTALGMISIQLRQFRRAHTYFQRAADAYPDEYAPWLGLSDLAMAQGDRATAQQMLAEAEKRGAPEAELERRRERTGDAPAPLPVQPGEVIIR